LYPIDLSKISGDVRISTEVCVIGAGPVGIAVARRLAERGIGVVLLERGAGDTAPQTDSNDVGFDARPYGGAAAGRAFGFGGTSTLWGGQLLPLTEQEVNGSAEAGGPRWPVRFSEISAYYETLDRWLGVDSSSFELAKLGSHPLANLDWTGFAPRCSKWLRFRRRHIGAAWKRDLDRAKNLQIWLNARVVELERRGRRIHGVSVRGTRARLTVSSERIVIAAGAIESTRLALSVFDAPDIRSSCPAGLGHYLHDHLSLRIGRLAPVAPHRMQSAFAPVFINGTMRTLRIELAADAANSARVPPAYTHVVADAPPESGFAVVRDALRAMQGRRVPEAWRCLKRVPAALPELIELAYWRAARGRLVYPRRAALFLHLDFQQAPDIRNRIYLGPDIDSDGCRKVRIDWNLRDDRARYAAVFEEHVRRFWERNRLQHTARLEFLERREDGELDPSNSYDIYHPAGTTRMAHDVESGSVDPNLRLFGIENVYIASTSVFPSLGAANPTYTAMALGLRLAEYLAQNKDDRNASAT
jgi:choline dehydrogenase-like flavoprotein